MRDMSFLYGGPDGGFEVLNRAKRMLVRTGEH